MRTLLLTIFLCTLPGLIVHAQYREVYFNLDSISGNEYPIPDENIYFSLDGFYQFDFYKHRDSTGEIILEPYLSEETERIKSTNPYALALYPHTYDFTNIAPTLDSLPDGKYIQYYHAVPVIVGDTLEIKYHIPACTFELKNNLPNGKASWYYPDGLLLQEGTFKNGIREGTWFRQQINYYSDLKNHLQKQITTQQYAYLNGLKSGQGINYETMPSYSRKFPGYIQEEILFFEKNKLHGPYLQTQNGNTWISGSFYYGKPIGTWEFYGMSTTRKHKIILLSHYTYNQDSSITQTPFFFFNNRELTTPNNFFISEPVSQSFEHSDNAYYMFMITAEKPNKFASFLSIPACFKLDSSFYYSYNNSTVNSFLNNGPVGVKDHHNIYTENYIDSCGVIFKFKGIYEEYFDNGQLKVRYDFDHPESLYRSIQYFPNGKIQHQVNYDPVKNKYIQSYYDTTGILIRRTSCNHFGVNQTTIFPKQYARFEGKDYQNMGSYWRYYNNAYSSVNDSLFLISETRDSTGAIISSNQYFPKQRYGKLISEHKRTGFKEEITYQINPDYSESTVKKNTKLLDFELTNTYTLRPNKQSWYQDWHKDHPDSLFSGFISEYSNSYNVKENSLVLLKNKKPYTGLLEIEINKNLKIKNRASRTTIRLTQTDYYSSGTFINRLQVIPMELIYTSIDRYKIKRMVLQFRKGQLYGKQAFYNNTGKLLYQHIQSDTTDQQYYYNQSNIKSVFPPGRYQETNSNSKTNPVTKMILTKSGDTLVMESTLEGDTVFLLHTYGSTGQYTIDKTERNERFEHQQFQDHRLINYYTINLRTNKRTSYYMPENSLFETYNQLNGNIQTRSFLNSTGIDSIHYFNKEQTISQIVSFRNGYLYQLNKFKDGIRTSSLLFSDSLNWEFPEIPYELKGHPSYHSLVNDYTLSGYLTQFYNGTQDTLYTGLLINGLPFKKRHFFRPNGQHYADFIFSDSYIMFMDTVCYFNADGKIISQGIIKEKSKTYDCASDSQTDQYNVWYILLDGKAPPDNSYQKNTYPDGTIMNEGTLISGKPSGFWKWYHPDGSLYAIGKYENGLRVGRWIIGDLSNVKYTGELCLEPDSEAYNELLKTLDIELHIYHEGVEIEKHFYKINH